jgi:hypothetical protein
MKSIASELLGKKASDLDPSFKINCFNTVIAYFNNSIKDGKTSAQEMLDWLKDNTIQVDNIEAETIIVVWSSSNSLISPDRIEISKLDQSHPQYPFGLVMEHAAVFVDREQLFQKASPKDEDPFELIRYSKMIGENYFHLSWIRVTYHKKLEI